MNLKSTFILLLMLFFASITFTQVEADYEVLLIQGNTLTHLDVEGQLTPMGHNVTSVPHADVIDGYDFSPYDVAIFMWDTPMTFAGYDDLIAANEACEIGLVSMSHFDGMDSLFIGHGASWTDATFSVANNSHWITEPWSVGTLPLGFTYKIKLSNIPDGVTVLGLTGADTALVVHDTYKRASSPYYGHTSGMPWNSDGERLMDRIICWAASDCCALSTTVNVSDFMLSAVESAATYQWIDCITETEIPGATNQIFNVEENGSYAVIINKDGCVDTSDCFVFTNLSTYDMDKQKDFRVYPNPSTAGQFTILSDQTELSTVFIFDNSGRMVYQSEMSDELMLDLKLRSGVYYIQCTSANQSQVIRMIVK